MKFFDVEQGSDSWFELRKGVPTASEFGRILPPKTRKPGAGARSYIEQLVGERFAIHHPERVENYTSRAMRWGAESEAEARRWYCLEHNANVTNGGFCMTDDGRFGASPDFLVGDDGCGELKCPLPATQVGYLLGDGLPEEYVAQVHGHLIVTGRDYCDFLSYCPGLPKLLVRVTPDEYTQALRVELELFWDRYQEALELVGTR